MRPFTHPAHSTPETDPAVTRLDQVWAATRPDAPSPELLDTLWAHASAELDRLGAAPITAPPAGCAPLKRSRFRVGSGLAAAAVVLLVAGVSLRSRIDRDAGGSIEPAVAVAVVPPLIVSPSPSSALRPIIDVGVDQTLVVTIDADGSRVDLQPQTDPLVVSTTLAEGTAHDIFDALESRATP